ncbi:MAG: hypothetical protein JWP10_1392, partial [Nocardioidaceae bacterium]|nr:hypothetical protein [Nocardioidaceae bacterium]
GWAALTSDVCAEEGIELPALSDVLDEINAVLPERTTANPLDMTGFAMGRSDVVESVLTSFASSPDVDAMLLQWFLDESAEASAATFVEAACKAAALQDKPVILGSVEDGHPGPWAHGLADRGVAVGRGIRATARGLATMAEHVLFREQTAGTLALPAPVVVPVPLGAVVDSSAGRLLTFGPTMELLEAAGVPVAPYVVVDPAADLPGAIDFAGPYVVKLADVPHRSDIGAVRLGVDQAGLAASVTDLRSLASASGLPESVVIQPQVKIFGEAFVGVQGSTGLGPLVAFGVGGIFVELLGRVAGRLAPLADHDAYGMLDEMADTGVFDGARGQKAWDRDELARLLQSVGALAAGAQGWLLSLDVNPLALTDRGFVALDGLCLLRAD